MKPLHLGNSKWYGAAFVFSGLLLSLPAFSAKAELLLVSSVRASAAPELRLVNASGALAASIRSRAGKATTGRKLPLGKSSRRADTSSGGEELEIADAYSSGTRKTAGDLTLTEENARKAEAFTLFAQALLAGDAAEKEKELDGYRKTLALDPGYTELAVQLSYELTKRNDISGAIQVLKDSIKAAPKVPLPLIFLSQIYAKHLKKPELAQKYAEQALALAPDNFQAHHALYELQVEAGQKKKAEEVLERAARSKSADPKFWLQLGDLYTRLYLKEDGTSEPEHIERMNALYHRAADCGKMDSITLAKVGDYFALSRQVPEAIPYYEAALKLRTNDDDPALANLREKLARAYLVNQRREEAIEMLETVAHENPTRFETFELLGELYQEKGEIEKAMRSYEQTMLIDSSRPDNYLRLAEIYLRLKRADKAVDIMRTARGKFPDVPQIGFTLAMTLSQAKRHTEAMTAFAEAEADARNSHEEMLTSSFYFQYGAAAEQAGLVDKSAELLRESIRLDPSSAAQAYNYLGYMWTERGINLDEAGEYIRKALETDPENGAYLDSIGWYYFKKGDYDRALKELLHALEAMKEDDAVVFEHIGDTYSKLGKTAEAASFWEKSLAMEDNPKVREKLDIIRPPVTQSGKPAAQ